MCSYVPWFPPIDGELGEPAIDTETALKLGGSGRLDLATKSGRRFQVIVSGRPKPGSEERLRTSQLDGRVREPSAEVFPQW